MRGETCQLWILPATLNICAHAHNGYGREAKGCLLGGHRYHEVILSSIVMSQPESILLFEMQFLQRRISRYLLSLSMT